MKVHITLFLAVALMSTATTVFAQQSDTNPVPVTVTNFIRAETDMYFGGIVKDGALGSSLIAANLQTSTSKTSSG